MSDTTKQIDDGGPAFPSPDAAQWDIGNRGFYPGMSYRQWLAGMAMQGLLANPEAFEWTATRTIEIAMHHADAMIAAEKESKR